MRCGKLLRSVVGLTLSLFMSFAVGCGTPAVTPELTSTPTSTPTPIPPTATPTFAEKIMGTWHSGSYYIRFDEDGTLRHAHFLDTLDSRPYAISSYQFEGANLVITEVSVSGVPSCGKEIGSYEIRLLESGNIQIVAIDDQCHPRRGDMVREYEPIR